MLALERFFHDDKLILTAFDLVFRNADVHADGIHRAGFQLHKRGVVFRALFKRGKGIPKRNRIRVFLIVQGGFAGAVRLNGYNLARKVRKGGKAIRSAGHKYLRIVHVSVRPSVKRLAIVHRKAVPKAVDRLSLIHI